MKNIIISSCAVILASSICASAEPIKLSVEKASMLFQGLNANLNGPAPEPSKPSAPYKLNSDVTYAIALDMSRLSDVVTAYQKSYKLKFVEISKGHPDDIMKGTNQFKVGSDGEKLMTEAMQPAWEAEQTIDLMKIKRKDLNIGTDPAKENQIPPAALVPLIPIIIE